MKNLIYIMPLVIVFFVIGCSNDSMDTIDEVKVSKAIPSTAPPTDLWIINMSLSGRGGTAGILGCNNIPIHSEKFIRDSLKLTNETFISVFAANYNQDGSFINSFNDYPRPLQTNDNRNKVSLTFIFDDSENANAELVINDPFVSVAGMSGIVSFSCGDTSHKIGALDFTIREIENDSGVLSDFSEIKFSDEELEIAHVDRIFLDLLDNGPTINYNEFKSMLSTTNAVYKVRIVETLIIENNEKTLFIP